MFGPLKEAWDGWPVAQMDAGPVIMRLPDCQGQVVKVKDTAYNMPIPGACGTPR